MAFTPNQFLNNNSNILLRDQQHAARTFVDDQFRLAPKHKFLFHVAFNINIGALRNIDLVQRHRNEINMLVKSCSLPNFSVTAETLNQYNRKKNVQTTHKHNPIEINFHDDNMGIINQLWQNYYKYYYADPISAEDTNAYRRNATKNYSFVNNNYGLDNGSLNPFFNYITIYQMARHEYVSYKLHNPIITNWNHNRVDYSQNTVHDNQMQLQYEAVSYNVGEVTQGDPEGFSLEHYDQTPSPLQVGDGGSITTSQPTFSSSSVTSNPTSILENIASTVNGYQNTPFKSGTDLTGIITNTTQTSVPSITGLQGFTFPTSTPTTAIATPSTINNIPTASISTTTTTTPIQTAQRAIDQLKVYSESAFITPAATLEETKTVLTRLSQLLVVAIDNLQPIATTRSQQTTLFETAQAVEKFNNASRSLSENNPQSLIAFFETSTDLSGYLGKIEGVFADSGLNFN